MKKNIVLLVLGALSLSPAIHAAPFLAVGDGAELFVTGTVGVREDDNIFLAPSRTEDTIFDLTPGALLVFGKDMELKGTISAVDDFSSYKQNSKLNTNLFSGDFASTYDDGKTKLGAGLFYHELNQNTVDNRGLTRRNVFSANGSGEMDMTEITAVGAGITFTHTDYRRVGYISSDDTTIPLNFYYKWTPKVDLSAGYQYRDYDPTIGPEAKDNFFNVGARGEFTPLLTGQFRVGYTDRSFNHGVSAVHMLGLDGNLSYAVTPKSTLTLTAQNAPDTSPQGLQEKNTMIGLMGSLALDDQWSANAGVNYRAIKYPDHTDHYTEGTVGATYTMNAYVKFVGAYVYRRNNSSFATSQFTENVFSLSANLRY